MPRITLLFLYMPRKTSALFIACAENVILSLVVNTLLSGIMELVAPADFAPAMRASILSQVVLVVVTSVGIAVLSAVERARHILSNKKRGDENGDDQAGHYRDVLKWIERRRSSAMNMLAVANSYSVCVLAISLLYVGCFLQGASGWGLSDTLKWRTSKLQANITYASSQRLDWVQSSIGASGWVAVVVQQQNGTVNNTTAATDPPGLTHYEFDAKSLPLFGSLYAGAVLAYLVVCTLLGLYISLSATPEGDGSYLILEPRGLVVANGIIVFASMNSIDQNFAACAGDVAGASTQFAIFCLLACWADELPALLRAAAVALSKKRRDKKMKKEGFAPLKEDGGDDDKKEAGNNSDKKSKKKLWAAILMKVLQGLLLTIMCWVPLISIYMIHTGPEPPGVIVTISSILGVISNIMGVLDVAVFSEGGTLSSSLVNAFALVKGSGSETDTNEGEQNGGTATTTDTVGNPGGEGDEKQPTQQQEELSLDGFPGAGPAEAGAADTPAESSSDGPPKGAVGSIYRMVGAQDIWNAAGVIDPVILQRNVVVNRSGSISSSSVSGVGAMHHSSSSSSSSSRGGNGSSSSRQPMKRYESPGRARTQAHNARAGSSPASIASMSPSSMRPGPVLPQKKQPSPTSTSSSALFLLPDSQDLLSAFSRRNSGNITPVKREDGRKWHVA